MAIVTVISCKLFDSPHRHATDQTKIYQGTGVSLGPRFDVCPFGYLKAKDNAFRYVPQLQIKPIRIVRGDECAGT